MSSSAVSFDIESFNQQATEFLNENPDIERLELLFVDLNGVLRGKWLPVSSLLKLAKGAFRLPRSASFADIWSDDVEKLGLGIQVGDPDAICLPIIETLSRVPWSKTPSAQMLLTMVDQEDMQPCKYSAREVLQAQIDRLSQSQLTAVVATELEFYLLDVKSNDQGLPQPPLDNQGKRLVEGQQYNMDILDSFSPVLDDILKAAVIQNLPVDTTIAECGAGQFEINLLHQTSALLAADQAVLLKRLIKQVAKQHNLRASFMAKPYASDMGNGMHVHASLNDGQGVNIFASNDGAINQPLQNAVAGLLETMQDTQLIYAPHLNSYRRFLPGFFAPISPCWGFDHRGAAVRVPEVSGVGARLEHRVSGADTNPYLVVAAVLAGIQWGLEHKPALAEALCEDDDLNALQPMTRHWAIAIENMKGSKFVDEYLGAAFNFAYTGVKNSEELAFAASVTQLECDTYLLKV